MESPEVVAPEAGRQAAQFNMDTTVSLHPRTEPAGLTSSDLLALQPRYEVFEEVARGGMGIVYRARHKRLARQVAIKITLPGASTERFLREAQVLAKIRSPYVVAVHDFEILPNGSPLLVMEWVEGTNLRQFIQTESGLLSEDRVLTWMRQVCEGMLAATEEGIIHRDLKPSNLLIDTQGRARVSDFGLARGPACLPDLSQRGEMMGTPYYMAPEQAEDPGGVDTRADIYSFGATFYHALTGKPPFDGVSPFSILYKHKTEPLASPQALRRSLSDRTSELLERCLAKEPQDRFSSFAEVLKHLEPTAQVTSPWAISDDTALMPYLERYRTRRASYLNGQQGWNVDLDSYTFPRGQGLRLIRGDIVAQQVDALVSSDTCYLYMEIGVSAAIRQAAGAIVATEARRQAPVRPGRAAVTSAGDLPARLVFHAVTVGIVNEEIVRPSRDLIAELVASCFYHADSHDVRSIAFPLLGTGAQQFPRDVCLDTMFQALARMFLRGLTSVCEARIVLFDEDR
jgi:serine/threonine protein kinase